jgi:hypothetical protein
MNALGLKQYLSKFDDGQLSKLEVVRPGSDHSYTRSRSITMTDAEKNQGDFFEYFDDANMSDGGKKIQVLLVE